MSLLAQHREHHQAVTAGTCTPQDLLTWFDEAVAQRAALIVEATKAYKVADLKGMLRCARGGTKAELVQELVNAIQETYVLGGYSYAHSFGGDYITIKTEAQRKAILATTPEKIAKHAADIKAANDERNARYNEIIKACENPQTLKDFEIVQRYKKGGILALAAEYRTLYDQLCWSRDRNERDALRAKQAIIEAVDLADVEMMLIQTKHTVKGHDLYVVQLSSWLDRKDWDDLNEAAKALGGWWSGYDIGGAVPGFQFRIESQAKAFMTILENDVSTAEVREEARRLARLGTRDRLLSIAARMHAGAEATLTADRKTNTARRAGMAAAVCDRARHDQALAATLERVANLLIANEAHPLDGIRHRTHLEQLNRCLLRAHRTAVAQDPNRRNDESITVDDILHAKLPEIGIAAEDVLWVAKALEKLPYCVLARQHLIKLYGERTDHMVWFRDTKSIEYATKIGTRMGKQAPWFLRDALEERRRLERMGIRTGFDLRCALRAYLEQRQPVAEEPERDRLVRALIGADIPGFFPTPSALVRRLLELADLRPGQRVIEPSAGKGDIADAIAAEYPEVNLTCVELRHALAEILRTRHENVITGDWFTTSVEPADRIIMNPPFEGGADIEHVRLAYDRLAPGGRLVAIMSAGAISRSDAKTEAFQTWLESLHGEWEHNPEGSFQSSFRPTGVATITVVIDRPQVQQEKTSDAIVAA